MWQHKESTVSQMMFLLNWYFRCLIINTWNPTRRLLLNENQHKFYEYQTLEYEPSTGIRATDPTPYSQARQARTSTLSHIKISSLEHNPIHFFVFTRAVFDRFYNLILFLRSFTLIFPFFIGFSNVLHLFVGFSTFFVHEFFVRVF